MTVRHPVRLSPVTARSATWVEREGWRIAETFTSVEAEAAAVRHSVGLSDLSARGKVLVQGREAVPALQKALGSAPSQPGKVVTTEGDGLLACLTREEWYLTTPVGGEARALERVTAAVAAAGVYAHVTDLTHANGALMLAGPQSGAVLAKLCGLDFHPSKFGNHTAAPSGLAKVSALVIRDDLSSGTVPAYQIHVNRSETDYLWMAVFDAAGEFGVQAVGFAALEALR